MRLLIPVLLFAVLLGGCAEFQSSSNGSFQFEQIVAQSAVADFKARTPDQISMLNSIVFEFAWQQFLGVGFIEVQPPVNSFRVICLNPMGVKLFDLAGDHNGVKANFVLEPLTKYGDFASAVAIDIKRIYFNLLPAEDAMHYRLNNRLIFGKGQPGGYLEHVFAGPSGDLVEKRYYSDQIISWSVGYADYADHNGKSYPRSIVLTDYTGGYRLKIREKEQIIEKDQE